SINQHLEWYTIKLLCQDRAKLTPGILHYSRSVGPEFALGHQGGLPSLERAVQRSIGKFDHVEHLERLSLGSSSCLAKVLHRPWRVVFLAVWSTLDSEACSLP
ncbi:hypothetical protein GW17_00045253, partial [Ensete ventricosum]